MEMKCDEGDQKISNMKVAQNGLKHNLILDFFEIWWNFEYWKVFCNLNNRTNGHQSDHLSRSTLETVWLKTIPLFLSSNSQHFLYPPSKSQCVAFPFPKDLQCSSTDPKKSPGMLLIWNTLVGGILCVILCEIFKSYNFYWFAWEPERVLKLWPKKKIRNLKNYITEKLP